MSFNLDFLGLNAPKDSHFERHGRDGRRLLYAYLLIYAILFIVTYAVSASNSKGLDPANYALILYFISALIALLLNQAGKPYQGIWLNILMTATVSLATAFLNPVSLTRSIIFASIQLLLIAVLTTSTLPARAAERALGFSIACQFGRILIEANNPAPEQPGPAFLFAALIISALIWTAGIIFIARRFSHYPLRTKLIFSFLAVTLIPLTILGSANTLRASRIIQQYSTTELRQAAEITKISVDDFLSGRLDALQMAASYRDFGDFLELPAQTRTGSGQAASALESLRSLGAPAFLKSFSLLDRNGLVVLDTDETRIGTSAGDQPYFLETLRSGVPGISPLYFPADARDPELYFCAPVKNSRGEIIGALRANYNGQILQNLALKAVPPKNGKDALQLVLIDQDNFIRLAHTTHPEFLFSSYKPFTEAEIRQLTAERLLPANDSTSNSLPQPEAVASLTGLSAGATTTFEIKKAAESGETATAIAAGLVNAPWIVIAQQPSASLLEPVTAQTRSTVQISILMAAIGVAAAFLVSQVLTRPVVQLTGAVKAIAAGNLEARAKVETPDEFGEMAESFNAMGTQLQDILQGLEKRVAERTAELQLTSEQFSLQADELARRSRELGEANLRLERRASQMQAIAETASAIAALQNTAELLPHITRLISNQFGFYHVGIFLLDANKRFAVLSAANSQGGQRMLEHGHRLEIGKVGIVGFVGETGEARIALDTDQDAVFFNNPDLPETRSEMALPLKIHKRLIGVLDVQSTEENAFSREDIQVLLTLADQVSIAIENSQLFEETRKSLVEIESLYRRYLGTQWQSALEKQKVFGYRSTTTGASALKEPLSSQEYDEALASGNTILKADADDASSLVVPIKIHGQALGIVNLRQSGGKEWSEDEISLVQAIAERAAISAENALLFEQTTERAERERKVSEITSKIRSTNNPEEMIKIALNELKQALNLREARILPYELPRKPDQK